MKFSARNVIPGTIVEIQKGQTTAHVRLGVGGKVITASITNQAVDELKLAKGQKAHAVIKASDAPRLDRMGLEAFGSTSPRGTVVSALL